MVVTDIQELAELLSDVDGKKKNGTSDVESRYYSIITLSTGNLYIHVQYVGTYQEQT